jgi:HEAT repeat protein
VRWLLGAGMTAVLGLLLCGCNSKTKEEQTEEKWKYGISTDEIQQLAKEKGVGGLKPLLKSESKTVRMGAIGALAEFKNDKEATKLLVNAAADESKASDAYFAVQALAKQGAPETKEVIERLIKSQDPYVRMGAYQAVAIYGDKELYPLLDKAASDADPNVQRLAASLKQRLR